ncbi:hypothetical protein [Streptomyces sp. CoH17]|uniref:hypothetical protein n=1 Tax=Streptomyces sp. CoH17 TaxID=2992806 RepID=UPI0022716FFD|nr:hypothetical protein [Streptomyces sp. CoH17]
MTIYADYREVFPQWPEVPPQGLKVAVDSATMDLVRESVYGAVSGQVVGQGPAMATLNVPGAQAGPVTTAGVPGFLADPGMDLTDPASEQFRRSAGITDPQYGEAAAVQEGFLQHHVGEDPLSPPAAAMPYGADDFLLDKFGTDLPPLPSLPGQSASPGAAYGSFDALRWEPAPALVPPAAVPSATHPAAVTPYGLPPEPAPLHTTPAHPGTPAPAGPHNPIAEHATQYLPTRNTPPTTTTTHPTHTTAHTKGRKPSRR